MRTLLAIFLTVTLLSGGCLSDTPEAVVQRTSSAQNQEKEMDERSTQLDFSTAINDLCPRSGKPIVPDSLALYRGHTVGFCNTHCRDDFVANMESSDTDRAFFDQIIDAKSR